MKKRSRLLQKALVFAGVLAATAFVHAGPNGIELGPRAAHAIIGRPLTPVSYAGAARRTVRRTTAVAAGATAAAVATTGAVHVATLPAGCVAAGGVYRCGAVSYRAVFQGPNIVYVRM